MKKEVGRAALRCRGGASRPCECQFGFRDDVAVGRPLGLFEIRKGSTRFFRAGAAGGMGAECGGSGGTRKTAGEQGVMMSLYDGEAVGRSAQRSCGRQLFW
jgi:hypothetical protein